MLSQGAIIIFIVRVSALFSGINNGAIVHDTRCAVIYSARHSFIKFTTKNEFAY